MGILPLEDIQPGMFLAADLRTPQGRLLLPKQASIDAKHLRMARIWGIIEADIEGVFPRQRGNDILDCVALEKKDVFAEILAFRFADNNASALPIQRLMDLFVQRANAKAGAMNAQELRELYIGVNESSFDAEATLPQIGKPVLGCEELLRKDPSLACLPDIFYEIVEASKSPTASAAHIAEIIGKDPSLACRLLRLVNSAFYGFESKVDTLARAVAIVGTVQIANLALGVTVTTFFKGIPTTFVDMRSFWEHSIAVGVISRLLGVHHRVLLQERLFVAGLLHDLGRLIIYRNHLRQAQALIALAIRSPEPLNELEREAWGFTHADLGCALLRQWRIPESIQEIVAHHHVPFRSGATDETKLVHLADVIAYALGFGHTGLRRVPPLCLKTWDHIGLSANTLSVVAAQTENQLRALMRVFLVD